MKNVIIVGSSGLIGNGLVFSLSKNCTVIGIDLENSSKQKNFYKCNINNEKNLVQTLIKIQKKFNFIDGMVNAAYPRNKNLGLDFEKLNLKDFNQNINLNLGSLFLLLKHSYKIFKKQKIGSFINMASIYGTFTPRYKIYKKEMNPPPATYAAIKSAQIMMIKHFASRSVFKKESISYNSISPGGVSGNEKNLFKSTYKKYSRNIGMIDPNDLSGLVNLLLSKQGRAITGQNFIIDDGFTL